MIFVSAFEDQHDLHPQWGSDGDIVAPTLLHSFPIDDSINIETDASLIMTFSEDVLTTGSDTQKISLFSSAGLIEEIYANSSQISVEGDVVTITPQSPFSYGEEIYVQVESGVFTDTSGNSNAYAGISNETDWNFTTPPDIIPPEIVSLSPANAATQVALDASLSLTFDESVQTGTGNIAIYSAADTSTPVETYDVETSAEISVADTVVTITPTSNFLYGSEYYVLIDSGALTDQATQPNAFGIVDPDLWRFTTLDLPLSLANSSVVADPFENVSLAASSTLSVRLADQNGDPLTGVAYLISAVTDTLTSSVGAFSEDAQEPGLYTADLTSTQPGEVEVRVSANGTELDQVPVVSFADPPGVPTDLVVTQGDQSLELTWQAPTVVGSSDIVDYGISLDGGTQFVEIGGTATTYTATGLDNGTAYDVTGSRPEF